MRGDNNILTFILLSSFLAINCNKTHHSEQCDPTKKFTADFKTGYTFLNGQFAESDTILGFSAFFEADSAYDSVTWHIGSGIYNTKNIHLNFPAAELGKTITVTLIATGQRNTCNPLDAGIDTVEKTFTLLYSKELNHNNYTQYDDNYLVTLPFLGKWHGAFTDNPNDTFTVTINNNGRSPGGFTDRFYSLRIYNLPQGCSVKQESGEASCEPVKDTIQKYFGYQIDEISYNAFYVPTQSFLCCPVVQMFGMIDTEANTITIECLFISDTNSPQLSTKRIFHAKKVQ